MDKVTKNERGLNLVTEILRVTKQVQKISFIRYILSD